MTTFKLSLHIAPIVEAMEQAAENGVRDSTEHLLTEANKSVPHDEGTLERSGSASSEGTKGAVSYDTPYAVRQHEDMSLHHHGKGQSKWLENTMGQEAETMGNIIAQAIRGVT